MNRTVEKICDVVHMKINSKRHLCITSSDRIKEGDWYIDDCNEIRKSHTSDKEYWKARSSYKKIIAATDRSLNLPEIGEVIQYYEKDEKVIVEYEAYGWDNTDERNVLYKPKVNPDNTISIRPLPRKEKFYTRKEVIDLIVEACQMQFVDHPQLYSWIYEKLR